MTIIERFEEQVARTPHQVAVIFNGNRLTYQQLNSKANRLACTLRKMNVTREEVIGLMVDRSLEMIIGIFGILKAGGAFLPLSEHDPQERINDLIADSAIRLALTKQQYRAAFPGSVTCVVLDDNPNHSGDAPDDLPRVNAPGDLAYVMYTSGSTGKPKGVMIEHQALLNRLEWMQQQYPIGENDTILQKTPNTFDVSVWELLWWSFTGASLCFLMPGMEKYPMAITDTVEQHQVTIIHFVPSMLSMFLHYVNDAETAGRLRSLKKVFCSGEALKANHVEAFKTVLGNNGTTLTNLYGPTEATIDVTYYDIDDNTTGIIPIGKPIQGIQTFVINDNKVQPAGKTGELYVAGCGVARGYLNRVELTAERFITNPNITPGRMYRTGDWVRSLPDGNLEYLERIDQQVKIHGIRIELGEIEATLNTHPLVRDSIVIVKELAANIKVLVAFYVSDAVIDQQLLKHFLHLHLPEYMVPKQLVFVTGFPVTANGKANRSALASLIL